MKHFYLAQTFMLAGFVAANLLTPTIYRAAVPASRARTGRILGVLRGREMIADVLVFGDSVGMSGLDGKLFADEADKYSSCFNLCSPGQTPFESALFYPLVPDETKLVIQMISADALTKTLPIVAPSTLRNFHHFGYDFEQTRTDMLAANPGIDQARSQSLVQTNHDSRDAAINYPNIAVRTLVRRDLALEMMRSEIHYPNIHSEPVDSATMSRLIDEYNPSDPLRDFIPHPETLRFFRSCHSYFEQRGIGYVIVLCPLNPALTNFTEQYRANIARKLTLTNLPILDMTRSMEVSDFVDHVHLSQRAGQRLTRLLVSELGAANNAVH